MLALADDAALARLANRCHPHPTYRRGQWLQTSKELAAARAELHRLPAIDTQRDPDATLN
jgi:hypothetical protein